MGRVVGRQRPAWLQSTVCSKGPRSAPPPPARQWHDRRPHSLLACLRLPAPLQRRREKEEVAELLLPLVMDTDLSMEVRVLQVWMLGQGLCTPSIVHYLPPLFFSWLPLLCAAPLKKLDEKA